VRDLSGWAEPREGTQARQVFDLYRAGYSPRRIALILDKTMGCVRVTLHYARCNVSRKHRT
jgi:DNA-directed RNA polymerase specialized sigma24 family protein